MSNGSYDLNLGSEMLILVGDIRSRSWPNIGGTYGKAKILRKKPLEKTNLLWRVESIQSWSHFAGSVNRQAMDFVMTLDLPALYHKMFWLYLGDKLRRLQVFIDFNKWDERRDMYRDSPVNTVSINTVLNLTRFFSLNISMVSAI